MYAENFGQLCWEAFRFLHSPDECDYFSERKASGSILTTASKTKTHSVPLCLFTAHYFLSYKLFIEKRFVENQQLLPFRCVPPSHIFASSSPESGDGRRDTAESSWSATGLSVCLENGCFYALLIYWPQKYHLNIEKIGMRTDISTLGLKWSNISYARQEDDKSQMAEGYERG